MAGLAGIAFELLATLVEKGLEAQEKSELDTCKTSLRKYKELCKKLQQEYSEDKKHSAQIIACLEDTNRELRRQAILLTKNNNDLLARLTASYVRETTGGVASMEEYDAGITIKDFSNEDE